MFNRKVPNLNDDPLNTSALNGLNKYCNFIEAIEVKDESLNNLKDLGFVLEKVIILIRHGDRGPLRMVNRLKELNCDMTPSTENRYRTLVEVLIQSKPKLEHLNLIDDFIDFPDERCKLARLTKAGLAQHVKLGHILGSTYATRLGLSGPNFNWKVTTTRYSRTFQSALAFTYGLEFAIKSSFDFLKVAQFEYADDTFFCGYNKSSQFCTFNCPNIAHLRSEHLPLEQIGQINTLVNLLARILSPLSNSASFKSPISIMDGISAYHCHQEALPRHSHFGSMNASHVEDVLGNICLQGSKLQSSPSYLRSSWLKVYGFLNEIIHQARFGKESLLLYSGHDITIEPLKAIFAIPDCEIPPYASRLIFEVYSKNSQKYIQAIYNGKIFNIPPNGTENVPFSNAHSDLNVPTSLISVDNFESFIKEKFALHTGAPDFQTACGTAVNFASVQSNEDKSRL